MKFVLGVVRPKMAMDFGSKEVEPRLMRGLFMDSPRTVFGDCEKQSGKLFWTETVHVCCLHDEA